ncbi:hypothetical protein N665_1482s0002 [Sinapis alba]|nr:hypothetical protein N665_1482s0002 [Sinapis alba]
MLVNIPHNVVVGEILEKLPVKSLLRFRAVLDDCGRASLASLSLGKTLVSLENHIRLKITRSCDGLTCLYSKTSIYVINPATRWHRKLPEARFQTLAEVTNYRFPYPFLGFSKDNIIGMYKCYS